MHGMIVSATPACSSPQSTDPKTPEEISVSVTGSVNFGWSEIRISAAKNSFQAIITPLYIVLKNIGLQNSLLGLTIVYTTFQLPFGLFLMRNSFNSDHLHRADGRRPSYFAWMAERDRTGVYAYYRLQLQLLLWQRPCRDGGRLVVKNPFVHLENMQAIFRLFSGATLVNLTRDIPSVVVSLCFKNRADRSAHSDHVRSEDVGADMVENLDIYYRRRAAQLAALTPAERARVITIPFAAWSHDPAATMRQVYDRIDQPWPDELARAMAAGIDKHARYGEQARYDLAEFGLREGELRERFEPYEAAFAERTEVIA